MVNRDQPDPLAAEKLQLFSASLMGLPKEEIRKAKVLYIRNAITEWHAAKAAMSAFGCLQLFFIVIPFFWPILLVQRKMMRAAQAAFREKIQNAIDVWRDDLQGERFDLDDT